MDASINDLLPLLENGDIVIDGGNSHYVDDIRRAKELSREGHPLRGRRDERRRLGPRARLLHDDRRRTGRSSSISIRSSCRSRRASATSPARPVANAASGTAEQGYLHCGPNGAGHFVKMVHNGIEYGLMAAYAEGMGILRAANIGKETHAVDAETTPLRDPRTTSTTSTSATWPRCGGAGASSPRGCWTSRPHALLEDPSLSKFAGRVSDSGEGRWTIMAAIDEAVPAPVLTAALYARFSSRGEADFQNQLLSAMRFQFGGHRGESRPRSDCLRTGTTMGDTHSDALVFFGATGDLAYKKIFPVAAGDGQARRPRCAGHRRGQGRLDPRPVARAGAGQRREARRASTVPRSPS